MKEGIFLDVVELKTTELIMFLKSFKYVPKLLLRNAFDIRNKDPSTLTFYQREQLKRYQEATKEFLLK